mgnify:CR=1 FL=1
MKLEPTFQIKILRILGGRAKLKRGGNWLQKTTTGWDLEVEWVDGSTSWVSLKDLKESNSLEVSQYAVNNRIDTEPAFNWWVKKHLKQHKQMIKMSQRRHIKPGYKFGLCVPSTVKEALEIDEMNKNTLWDDTIMKEKTNVRVPFDI